MHAISCRLLDSRYKGAPNPSVPLHGNRYELDFHLPCSKVYSIRSNRFMDSEHKSPTQLGAKPDSGRGYSRAFHGRVIASLALPSKNIYPHIDVNC